MKGKRNWNIMSDIEIVPLKLEHMDRVETIERLSFSIPWSRESMVQEIENNKFARYIAAIKFGTIIGYGGMWVVLDEAHITNIAVHPEYRGIGAASAIMEGLMELCRLENIAAITLEVRKSNIVAQSLYKKYGFVEEGLRKAYYVDNKEDAIIMWNHNVL
ncbi:MAG: ribosomal protein S18-alanine N-acetyltransferase [Clostridium sp.]|jgi:ribosomal-protein-alanine N-acetyltransferase|nr:ribosomal protein S18-alanine N-acetyltransferase [Clostridium sp.]MCI1715911.1 ribosomal protein S18-alanine N-acetyltransferase [Clostridium sp.]MCI1800417.1 ribosomal protein S18-alanine N-acetyltransferase [Clostridium sp.]MCI1814088.1 ribosomal protein S18-alanine N-acetyltransferase [Clostridium sp.]MCI1870986.1 ribosomal protein S18-alanine N-acetyltransferase [Clostridium sp.]